MIGERMFGLEADLELLWRMLVALLIGALVGIDRESPGSRALFGGVRTFILIAALGAVAAWMTSLLAAPSILAAGCIAVAGLLVTSRLLAPALSGTSPGMVSELAALVVYFLGAATILGNELLAVSLGIATTALLTLKSRLHAIVAVIDRDDLIAGLKLLFATFIVLPMLPDAQIDPWGALNPYKLWWLVILISSLSLIGYAAVRGLGAQRGLLLTGLFGGLVSSTATTLSFARQSQAQVGPAGLLAGGILLAWAIMFVRVIVEVAVVHPPLVGEVALPMAALGVASLAAVGVMLRRRPPSPAERTDVPLNNPFSLWEAIKFGLFFALVLLLVEAAQRYLPQSVLYGVAALAGTTDVDAITLSMAQEVRAGELPANVAVNAIIIAALSNTLVKAGMTLSLGSRALSVRIGASTAVLVAVGAAAIGASLLR